MVIKLLKKIFKGESLEDLIKEGDNFFIEGKYILAKKAYLDALKIEDNKKIRDKIKIIEKIEKLKKDADNLFENGAYNNALKKYEEILKLNPNDTNIKTNLNICKEKILLNEGELLFRSKKYEDALSKFKEVLKIDSKNSIAKAKIKMIENILRIEEINKTAKNLFNKGKYNDAIKLYNEALKLDPKNDVLWNNCGNVYYALKDYQMALKCYEKALSLNPKNELAMYNKALILKDMREYKKALSIINTLMHLNPKNEKVFELRKKIIAEIGNNLNQSDNNSKFPTLQKAVKEYKNGNYYKAIELLNQCLSSNENDTEVLRYLGDAYLNIGNYSKALECFNKILKTNNKNVNAKNKINYVANRLKSEGLAHYKNRNYKDALILLDEYLKHNKKDTEAYYFKALCYEKLGFYEESLLCINNALKYNKNNKKLLEYKKSLMEMLNNSKLNNTSLNDKTNDNSVKNTSQNMQKISSSKNNVLGNFSKDEILKHFNKINKSSLDTGLLYKLGDFFISEGEYDKALKCYDSILNKTIEAGALWRKGKCLYLMNKFDESIKCFEEYAKRYKNSTIVYNLSYEFGNILYNKRDYENAIKYYQFIEKNYTNNLKNKIICRKKDLLEKIANCYYNLGDYNNALKYLKMDSVKNNTLLYNVLVKFGDSLLKKADYKNAINYYKEALKINNNTTLRSMIKSLEEQNNPPNLIINFPKTTFVLGRWEKIKVKIINKGEGTAKNVQLKFSDDFNVKGISPLSIKGKSSEELTIYVRPNYEGIVPLEIAVEYQHNNKTYQNTYNFEVEVKGAHIYKEKSFKLTDIINPSTPKTFPPELEEFYKNIQFIGQGGFARVFKAIRVKDNLPVAIKLPISLDASTGKSFIKELENWTKLNHPNIVKVYDYNILPIPYFEMELCDESLEDYLKRKRVLDVKEASYIIFNIAEGLKYAHNKGIIHRDLKPHNILLKNGIPKITDWGLSKVISKSTLTTRGGFTPHYASPEQINNTKTDERTDIWQLGVIFYQLTTGEFPFDGKSVIEIGMKIITKKPKPPKKINSEIDSNVSKIILKCLNKNPKDRYSSILELQRDLAKYLQITFKEELKKSITIRDFSRSAFYCGELFLMCLKINDGVNAYKYCGDLIEYAKGDIKNDLIKLKEMIAYRVENKMPIPEEIISSAEVIVHKIKLKF
ncbi:serine/threonine protein kinase with TPR repeats [Methanocaldococcus vulcanius M7]|uniref:Serine/threonine protein kinase with TPR repeats n=1 Tax=Methanocaldococcus vulcanius (strain ATCC 700851 / DSM 12094 / M7) TaxID=579137 RepID=C9RH09_METVM|nr:tetratricopeptide repeat protein [Methanocaldococcus vulcanius]ACX72861.1 serine/threonine protein kinase with TPR repeats [Methanocaldococcus vulcanius M7]